MTLNAEATPLNVFDVLEGSITDTFEQIDNCIKPNEEVSGKYRIITQAAYNSNGTVQNNGFTHVCFSVNGPVMVDLENSYITAEVTHRLKFNRTCGVGSVHFVGYKSSLDAIDRYEILCNSQVLYSQPYCAQESFILQNGISDLVKTRKPFQYTTYENAWNRDTNVCGVYITGAAATHTLNANQEFDVTIPIKLELQQFLVLSNLKMLPSFFGKWEIKLYFTSSNLIVCPCDPTSHNIYRPPTALAEQLTYGFTQINQPFQGMISSITAGNPATTTITGDASGATRILSSVSCVANNILMNLATFELRTDIYQGLKLKYMEKPFILPTNTLTITKMVGEMSASELNAHTSLSLENCDTLFVLLPESPNHKTCYFNPNLIGVQMAISEFGHLPTRAVATRNDPRFIQLTLDALNLASSPLTSMNKDLSSSLYDKVTTFRVTSATAVAKTDDANQIKQWGDRSNFLIGIPVSKEGYQNGISSPNSNLNFQFIARTASGTDLNYVDSPTLCFLIDNALIIQIVPNSDIPIVKLTSKSVV